MRASIAACVRRSVGMGFEEVVEELLGLVDLGGCRRDAGQGDDLVRGGRVRVERLARLVEILLAERETRAQDAELDVDQRRAVGSGALGEPGELDPDVVGALVSVAPERLGGERDRGGLSEQVARARRQLGGARSTSARTPRRRPTRRHRSGARGAPVRRSPGGTSRARRARAPPGRGAPHGGARPGVRRRARACSMRPPRSR